MSLVHYVFKSENIRAIARFLKIFTEKRKEHKVARFRYAVCELLFLI